MKMGGSRGDSVAGPLFPRLHVNDADKGRLRAPPRNKMALYEMFCTPSHLLRSPDISVPSASLNEEDDFTIPTASQPEKHLPLMDREKTTAPAGSNRLEERENHGSREETKSRKDDGVAGNESINNGRSGLCPGEFPEEEEDGDDPGTSMDSELGFGVAPDDVVRLIGSKYFWKVRRAIADQQRIFRMQVFELHRLIKVQELLSGSPHVLLEDISPSEKQPQGPAEDPSDFLVNAQMGGQLDLVSAMEEVDPASECPVSSGSTPLPWLVPVQTLGSNQWLVPVMSPTEGLIYKPYGGPYPPQGPLLTNGYGGPGPAPQAHQQIGIGVPVSGPEADRLRQDSWSSCHVDKPRDSVTPLPWVSPLEGSGQKSQVIKVVPHNPKSTTESAARIFKRIQRERQQQRSV